MVDFLSQFQQSKSANVSLQLANLTVLKCQKVVRVIPNKRVVCQGFWQGKPIYAKLFFGADAAKYAARDAAGVKFLLDAKIDVPALLYAGETHDTQLQNLSTQVLIFEAIEPAFTAEQVWPDLDQNQRLILAKNLVAEVAKHHNANLLQTDLYLKNFLVTDKKIYTLDGDGIRKFANLKDDQALQNLAVLWSKFDVLDIEKWQQYLAETYSETRAWNKVVEPKKLAAMANQHRIKVASNYADKKVFRTCTDAAVSSTASQLFAISKPLSITNLPNQAASLDVLIEHGERLKSGNTCTVALANIDGQKVVIKRYNIKSFWHGVSRVFRPSRAADSWANAHRLTILGVATAKPIALLEQRFFCLRGKAYFLAEHIVAPNARGLNSAPNARELGSAPNARESVSAPDVAQYFAQTQDKAQRAQAVKNVVTLFYRLYLLQISHGDMKASNIKMVDNKPVLIDLDSMRQHKTYFTSRVAHLKDLSRFMQNWQNAPALYNAFVKTFKVVYPDMLILIKAGIGANRDKSKEISS